MQPTRITHATHASPPTWIALFLTQSTNPGGWRRRPLWHVTHGSALKIDLISRGEFYFNFFITPAIVCGKMVFFTHTATRWAEIKSFEKSGLEKLWIRLLSSERWEWKIVRHDWENFLTFYDALVCEKVSCHGNTVSSDIPPFATSSSLHTGFPRTTLPMTNWMKIARLIGSTPIAKIVFLSCSCLEYQISANLLVFGTQKNRPKLIN